MEYLYQIVSVIVGFGLGFLSYLWKDRRERKLSYQSNVLQDLEIVSLYFRQEASRLKHPEFGDSWIYDELTKQFPGAWMRLCSVPNGITGKVFLNKALKISVSDVLHEIECEKPLPLRHEDFAPVSKDRWLDFYVSAGEKLAKLNRDYFKTL